MLKPANLIIATLSDGSMLCQVITTAKDGRKSTKKRFSSARICLTSSRVASSSVTRAKRMVSGWLIKLVSQIGLIRGSTELGFELGSFRKVISPVVVDNW